MPHPTLVSFSLSIAFFSPHIARNIILINLENAFNSILIVLSLQGQANRKMYENPEGDLLELIEQRKDRFQILIDSLPHFVWESEPDGTYSYINKRFLDWSALTLEQLNAEGLSSLIYLEDKRIVADTWQQAFINKTEFNCEYRMKDGEGNYLWFLVKTVNLKESDSC